MPLLKIVNPKTYVTIVLITENPFNFPFKEIYSVVELDSLSITNSKYTISFY